MISVVKRRLDQLNDPNEASVVGYCRACGSSALEPLPPNSFSRKPGFVCTACEAKHRGVTSTWLITGILLLGLVMAGVGMATWLSEDGNDKSGAPRKSPLRLVMIGLAVAGYAAYQYRVPTIAKEPVSKS